MDKRIRLEPVNDDNREAVLGLSVREDQPFVAPNDVSLRQADEVNAEHPGVARPFAIYADEKPVGFCMFVFDPENEDRADLARELGVEYVMVTQKIDKTPDLSSADYEEVFSNKDIEIYKVN